MTEKREKPLMLPLTSGDLREIAAYVDRVERSFGSAGNYTRLGKPVVGMDIRVALEGSEDTVGTVMFYDGWVGFLPAGWEAF